MARSLMDEHKTLLNWTQI